jgi:hypothetical protein
MLGVTIRILGVSPPLHDPCAIKEAHLSPMRVPGKNKIDIFREVIPYRVEIVG